MKFVRLIMLIAFGFLPASIHSAEIKGKVKSVRGNTVSVAIEGDAMPPAGTNAEIFFKLAGSNEEISVATGTVGTIDHGAVQVNIDNATGNVENGHLVRFSISGTAATTAATATPAGSHLTKPIAFKRAIVGEWKQVFDAPPITFGDDGRVHFTEKGGQFTAKYRVDTTKTPRQIDLFEFDTPDRAGKDSVILGIFQIEGNRLKMELAHKGERPTSFGEGTSAAIRIGEAKSDSIVGEWRKEIDIIHNFTFTAEGTVRQYYETTGVKPSTKEYRYQLDDSTSPAQINFYFGEVNDNPGFRGIVEFDSNDRMRLDGKWTGKEEERPKTFGENKYELARTR